MLPHCRQRVKHTDFLPVVKLLLRLQLYFIYNPCTESAEFPLAKDDNQCQDFIVIVDGVTAVLVARPAIYKFHNNNRT